jgi:hypothetical protein
VLEVPATDPIIIEVLLEGTSGSGHLVMLERGGRVVVDVPSDNVYLRTVSGEMFVVTVREPRIPERPASAQLYMTLPESRVESTRTLQTLDFRDERRPLLPDPRIGVWGQVAEVKSALLLDQRKSRSLPGVVLRWPAIHGTLPHRRTHRARSFRSPQPLP